MSKKYSILLLAITLVIGSLSCKKEKAGTAFSNAILNFVPKAIIDSMKARGMTINEGENAPMINGIYTLSKNVCTYDNSGDNRTGDTFDDYRYRFYDQNGDSLSIKLDEKDISHDIDNESGKGAFLSGKNNLFTVFIQTTGVSSGIEDTMLNFISGEITPGGIKNMQTGIYMKGKGYDLLGRLMPVGASRIFKDDDGLAEFSTVYFKGGAGTGSGSMISSKGAPIYNQAPQK